VLVNRIRSGAAGAGPFDVVVAAAAEWRGDERRQDECGDR
jgi:hypothetical protein